MPSYSFSPLGASKLVRFGVYSSCLHISQVFSFSPWIRIDSNVINVQSPLKYTQQGFFLILFVPTLLKYMIIQNHLWHLISALTLCRNTNSNITHLNQKDEERVEKVLKRFVDLDWFHSRFIHYEWLVLFILYLWWRESGTHHIATCKVTQTFFNSCIHPLLYLYAL